MHTRLRKHAIVILWFVLHVLGATQDDDQDDRRVGGDLCDRVCVTVWITERCMYYAEGW